MFKKGDRVIYLPKNQTTCEGKHVKAPGGAKETATVGEIYTVTDFKTNPQWDCVGGVHLDELSHGPSGVCAGRFRKVTKSSEDIIERLKAKVMT